METKLWSALIGLSKTVFKSKNRKHRHNYFRLSSTFKKSYGNTRSNCLVHKEKDKISPGCKTCTHPCGNTSDYDMSLIDDKKKELMNQILHLNDMNFIYRGLCYLGFDIDDSYIDELIEEVKK